MASNAVSAEPLTQQADPRGVFSASSLAGVVTALFSPLASLRLTVALFFLAIVLILVGTLAQVNMDMWEVMDRYFQPWVAWVDFQVFFPLSWFPNYQNIPGGFWFPGGATIGLAMVLNLLAAHLVRFRIQARGQRLAIGLVVLAGGLLLTALVIASGHNPAGLQGKPSIAFATLWFWSRVGAAVLSMAALGAAILLPLSDGRPRRFQQILLYFTAGILSLLTAYLFLSGERAYSFLGGDSGMRILWQLILATAAGAVVLAGCVALFRKRGGIVTLHLGIGLLMFGQFWVAKYDVEEQLTLTEGQTTSYARDIRQVELAVVDTSQQDQEEVVVIPESMLHRSVAGGSESWLASVWDSDSPVGEDGIIRHPYLPFDLQVIEYFRNADLHDATDSNTNLATAGTGLRYVAEPLRGSSGADSGGQVNLAAAYVRFTSKENGEDLGTFLLSQIDAHQDLSEQVTAGGKTYEVALRFKRNYKPYSVTLVDVRKDDYLGTDTPRNYSSDIRLVDADRGTDRSIHIWMNNPLRYAGETFYQSGYSGPPQFPTESSTIAVVTNSGWMIPYVSCMIVVVGLLAHFAGSLTRFLNRRETEMAGPAASATPASARAGKQSKAQETIAARQGLLARWLPLGVVALFALLLLRATAPPSHEPGEMQLDAFGRLPVIADGRVKPFDTLARNSLRAISNRYTFRARLSAEALDEKWPELRSKLEARYGQVSAAQLDEHRSDMSAVVDLIAEQTGENAYRVEEYVDRLTTERQPAIRWLLDVISSRAGAEHHKVFRIDNLEVLDTLGLERRKSHLYSLDEMRGGVEEFERQAARASQIARDHPERLSTYERKLLELDRRIRTYTRLAAAFQRPALPPLPSAEAFEQDRDAAMQQLRNFQEAYVSFLQMIESGRPPLSVPVQTQEGEEQTQWESYAAAWAEAFIQASLLGEEPDPALMHLNTILTAYDEGNAAVFNDEVGKYQRYLRRSAPTELREKDSLTGRWIQSRFGTFYGFEAYFNRVSPFFFCWWPYIAAFVMACLAWLGWSRPLNRAAFWLIAFTLVVHTLALAARVYISGRPPVTNLYSSAVFIGWAVVLFGLLLELFYRNGLGNAVGSFLGFCTLVIAHNLAGGVDTFAVLQAVLDTQFWLAVHVLTVTLGYATTFVAGTLGIAYVVGGWCSRLLTAEVSRELARMIYGILCFALLFSFFGTVLGGLWADDSWGRFWGWDPKENGALIIVLWNALVLHARWGGMVRERGLALLALGGNIVTSWSWFGVNELGIGLHSYGFTEGVLLTLGVFWATQLACIGLGLMPTRWWLSFRT